MSVAVLPLVQLAKRQLKPTTNANNHLAFDIARNEPILKGFVQEARLTWGRLLG
jgi:hypothetical protein